MDVEPDGTALFATHSPSESIYAANLTRREPNGSFVRIGPMNPETPATPTGLRSLGALEAIYAGASPELGRVFFYIRGKAHNELPAGVNSNTWPFDPSVLNDVVRSLYEYSGTGQSAPLLAGQDSEGKLLSECGIGLGGPPATGNTRGAVSEDGSRLFITAMAGGCAGENHAGESVVGEGPPATEIFARVAPQSFVPISESSKADCESCDTSAPAEATFAGASKDGSKVFFVTEQALLPGASGPNLYEFDFSRPAGRRVIRVSAGGAEAGVRSRGRHLGRLWFRTPTSWLTARSRGPTAEGVAPVEGQDNLYVFEQDAGTAEEEGHPEGRLKFIATLSEEDAFQWTANGELPINVTPNGRYALFVSEADLTAGDTSSTYQVFRYFADQTAGEEADEREGHGATPLVRVSVGEGGYNDNSNTASNFAFVRQAILARKLFPAVDTHPSISSDGSTVVFESADALTPNAFEAPNNEATNVYEYREGHVYLISDGTTRSGSPLLFSGSRLIGISDSGAATSCSAPMARCCPKTPTRWQVTYMTPESPGDSQPRVRVPARGRVNRRAKAPEASNRPQASQPFLATSRNRRPVRPRNAS